MVKYKCKCGNEQFNSFVQKKEITLVCVKCGTQVFIQTDHQFRIIEPKKEEIKKESTEKNYFTFTQKSINKNRFVVIVGSPEKAREEMFKRYGKNWAMQYSQKQWENCEHPIIKEKGTQAEIYNLQEIHLLEK